jgi:SAM-dependent methyltransferase
MKDVFLEEYRSKEAVLRYTRRTAGSGISYLLNHDYGRVYGQVLDRLLPEDFKRNGLRLLEFGCGAGMNLIDLVAKIEKRGIRVKQAYGTDFSGPLIAAAMEEADKYLDPGLRERVEFLVARNETIVNDLITTLHVDRSVLLSSFHLILGVNTFRYSLRLDRETECANQMFDLLDNGGVCVVIDMNAQFPLFRGRIRYGCNKQDKEFYIPTLEEYVRPFASAGFQVITAKSFCWIPHSAGPVLCWLCRVVAPILNILVPRHAMRSLVIARKPG